jgi:molybdopterin synthase sulfur carrier subunit
LKIKILFFASLRELVGTGVSELEVSSGQSIGQLWQTIAADFELLPEKVLCAVNQEYVDPAYQLQEGDTEVAFFPPVTGG